MEICNIAEGDVKEEIKIEILDENEIQVETKRKHLTGEVRSSKDLPEEDFLIKEEIEAEINDELEFKFEIRTEGTPVDDFVPYESIMGPDVNAELQKKCQPTFSYPCAGTRLKTNVSLTDDDGNWKAISESDEISRRSPCEIFLMDQTSSNCAFIENTVNSEEKLEINTANTISSSLQSISKKIIQNKTAAKNEFKSVHSETKPHTTTEIIHKKQRFPCKICESSYSVKSNLAIHTRMVHDGIKRYDCYFCYKGFFRLPDLYKHIPHHTKEQPHICCICGSKFAQEGNLNIHIKSVHEGVKVQNFECSFKNCSKRFGRKTHLIRHMRKHNNELPFKCDTCGSRFTESYTLNIHIKIVHQGFKRYKCSFKNCNQRFAIQSGLTEHMRIHKGGEHLFQCQICESNFVTNYNLLRHIQNVHQGAKRLNWKCTYDGCVYQSNQKSELAQHIKIHPGETLPTFQCEICKKKFAKMKYVLQHKKRNLKCQPD